MNSFFFLTVFPALWGSLSAFFIFHKESSNPTLKLVHVLFRHGHRNPDENSVIAGSLYTNESYYPEGWGQLTNTGKQREYSIGDELQSRYSDFLTKTWNINYLAVRSSNTNRTKMSVELMLAALYPPRGTQLWSLLMWLPIPFNYVPNAEDKELNPWVACGTRWSSLLNNITNTPENLNYFNTRYKDLITVLSSQLGRTITPIDPFGAYLGIKIPEEIGYPAPEWTKLVYPEPLHTAAVDFYYYLTNTTAIRRITAGHLLKVILADTQAKINGTLSPSDRKMFIYSAHEMNVGAMLLSLGAFKLTDIPDYGSYILFEVHEIDGVWGIKLFYQDYTNGDPHALKLDGCDYFCPYDTFYSLVEDLIPTEEDC